MEVIDVSVSVCVVVAVSEMLVLVSVCVTEVTVVAVTVCVVVVVVTQHGLAHAVEQVSRLPIPVGCKIELSSAILQCNIGTVGPVGWGRTCAGDASSGEICTRECTKANEVPSFVRAS